MPRETEHGKQASIRPLKLLRDSVLVFSVKVPGTTSKDVINVVLVTQYLDTTKEVGALSSHTNKELWKTFLHRLEMGSFKQIPLRISDLIPPYMLHEWHVAY